LPITGDHSGDSLHPFIAQNLAPGAIAKTDGWPTVPTPQAVSHVALDTLVADDRKLCRTEIVRLVAENSALPQVVRARCENSRFHRPGSAEKISRLSVHRNLLRNSLI
jgi:hypothetical protein